MVLLFGRKSQRSNKKPKQKNIQTARSNKQL